MSGLKDNLVKGLIFIFVFLILCVGAYFVSIYFYPPAIRIVLVGLAVFFILGCVCHFLKNKSVLKKFEENFHDIQQIEAKAIACKSRFFAVSKFRHNPDCVIFKHENKKYKMLTSNPYKKNSTVKICIIPTLEKFNYAISLATYNEIGEKLKNN